VKSPRATNERLKGVVTATPPERSWAKAVYHMYVIRCERRDELQKFLKDKGIETGIHYPVPKPFAARGHGTVPFHAEAAEDRSGGERILSLPVHGEIGARCGGKSLRRHRGVFTGRNEFAYARTQPRHPVLQ